MRFVGIKKLPPSKIQKKTFKNDVTRVSVHLNLMHFIGIKFK